ncbi:MAG TPA: tetratricopeptide repeat protein [Polyangia bacterium]|nr:tetratricopeptide repeat protein [Polyangia bacterium]
MNRSSFPLRLVGLASLGGCAHDDEPRPPKNLTALEKKLQQQPDDAHINMQAGDDAASSGDFLRAEQYYRRAEALGTPPTVTVPRILNVLAAARRYDEALELCRERLSNVPDDRATRMVEAAILEALDRPRDAERELTRLTRTRPDDPHPYLALGKLYRDSYHDTTRARGMFLTYLKLDPKGREAEAVRYQLEDWLEPDTSTAPTLDVPPSESPAAPAAAPATIVPNQ